MGKPTFPMFITTHIDQYDLPVKGYIIPGGNSKLRHWEVPEEKREVRELTRAEQDLYNRKED